MEISNKDYCSSISCQLLNETTEDDDTVEYSTSLHVKFGDNIIKVNVLCLICKHAKKLDMSKIFSKMSTTDFLKERRFK